MLKLSARLGISQATLWFGAACLLTVLVYLPGLSGPFLFDDFANLAPLGDWVAGVIRWQQVLLGNDSGILGRPLSMLSFMLDARYFGVDPFPYKLTNLFIHLVCGGLIFALCRLLLARDSRLKTRAPWYALAVSTVWLLHPIHASTVLYVIQRMAQLSAAFVLIALLCYVRGRTCAIAASTPDDADAHRDALAVTTAKQIPARGMLLWLFVAFPLATLAAVLSKENGLLAPLFALVLELAYFRDAPRPRLVRGFFLVFLLIPAALVLIWYLLHVQQLIDSYQIRDFTLVQRLLTEPRVLFDYVGTLVLPRGATMGLYGDDFYVSTGWFTPISTVLAIAAWIVLAICAWAVRRTSATFFAGVFLFLSGHVMESGIFPLEIYFEHRNYLPSLGIFLAIVGLLERAGSYLRAHTDMARVARFAGLMLVLALAVGTNMRAWSWQSWAVMVSQAAAMHPNSMRAQMDLAALYIKSNDAGRAYEIFAAAQTSTSTTMRNVAAINTVALDCQINSQVDGGHLSAMRSIAGRKLGIYEITAAKRLVEQINRQACDGLSDRDIAILISDIANRAPQNASTYPIWTLKHIAADFYARAGDMSLARDEAQAAWAASSDVSTGLSLAHLLIALHDYKQAAAVLTQVRARLKSYDVQGQDSLATAERELLASHNGDNVIPPNVD